MTQLDLNKVGPSLKLGNNITLRDNGLGVLEARNGDGTLLTQMHVADGVGANDATSKQQLDTVTALANTKLLALPFGADRLRTTTATRWLFPGSGGQAPTSRYAAGPLPACTLKNIKFAALDPGTGAVITFTVEIRPPGGPWADTALAVDYDQDADDVVEASVDVAVPNNSMIAVKLDRATNSTSQPLYGTALVLMEVG